MSYWMFHLKPLTPLHIGSGDTIEAYQYVVIDSRLYCFDPLELLLRLTETEQQQYVILVENNPGKLHQFLQERASLVKHIAQFSVTLTVRAQQLYAQWLTNPRAELSVYPFIKTTFTPYIPGSSVKGAIRTALLYCKVQKPVNISNARRLEQETFDYRQKGDIDPFITIKIGDSPPLADSTQLAVVRVYTKRQGQWQRAIPMLRELTHSLFSGEPRLTFTLPVQLKEGFPGYPKMKLTVEDIITACRQFYHYHAEQEANYLGHLPQAAQLYKKLLDSFSHLPQNSFPIRFGWGSGFDAVTINYAMRKRQTKRSRRLTEGKLPLGWALVEVASC